ncbi:hypothetical protein [Bradyrhizobium ganzhouense]|uniref:hypothetical protein n=1 Tax=Bradyrhizobium ganzhouense TaxID=1179767 RepID=UPI003CED4EEF
MTSRAINRGSGPARGTNNITYILALTDLTRAHQEPGHYVEAVAMFKQVLDALQKNVPPADPRTAAFAPDPCACLSMGRPRATICSQKASSTAPSGSSESKLTCSVERF